MPQMRILSPAALQARGGPPGARRSPTRARVCVLGALLALLAAPALAVAAGDPAPDFSLPSARGGSVQLRSLLAQGPVVLWFPAPGQMSEANVFPLVGAVGQAGASLLVIPVVGPDAAGLALLSERFPALALLHDSDGSVTFAYTGEFIPGISPRHNLHVVTSAGQVSYVRFWPGVPTATLVQQIRAAR